MNTTIDVELLNKWINALRSGEYTQTTGWLREGDCFCALGVLADVSGAGTWYCSGPSWYFKRVKSELYAKYHSIVSYAPDRYPDERISGIIVDYNDEYRKSFSEIADLLEELFAKELAQ